MLGNVYSIVVSRVRATRQIACRPFLVSFSLYEPRSYHSIGLKSYDEHSKKTDYQITGLLEYTVRLLSFSHFFLFSFVSIVGNIIFLPLILGFGLTV